MYDSAGVIPALLLIAVVETFGHDTTATMLLPAVTAESEPETPTNVAFWMKDDTICAYATVASHAEIAGSVVGNCAGVNAIQSMTPAALIDRSRTKPFASLG